MCPSYYFVIDHVEVAAFVKMVDGLGMECALDGGVISIKRKSIDNED